MFNHKTTSIALAMTALCGGAQAQSSVTISGLIDLGVYRGFDDKSHVGTIQRSHFTVSGAEDLGGGMAATFKLQHRFDADTGATEASGNKPFWHGESTVGIKGAFGHLRIGRALDVIYANDWAFDPWYNFDRIASPAWNNWHWNYATDRTSNNGSAEYGRLNNGVFYDTPSYNGFTAQFSGAFEETKGPGAGTQHNRGISLNYNQGPVALMAATSRNASGDTDHFFGAKYNFGSVALMGAYDESVFKGATTDSTAKVYTLGATYTMDRTSFKAGFGHRNVDGVKSQFVGLGASYSLSKRTSLYTSLGRQMPKGGNSKSAYGVGIAHSF